MSRSLARRKLGSGTILPQRFYRRDPVALARALVGRLIRRDGVVLRITEVEAYCWPGDTACHARSGRTARNAPLWGPPGRAYVYLCYGLHSLLNFVGHEKHDAGAVLVRACEPVAGETQIRRRRRGKRGPELLTGPGKVAKALGLDVEWSGHVLYHRGGLTVHEGAPPSGLLIGPRVGIDYADPLHRDAPWRFALPDSPWVTCRRTLDSE